MSETQSGPLDLEHVQRFIREQVQRSGQADPVLVPKICAICQGKGYRWGQKEGYPVVIPCVCVREKNALRALETGNVPVKYWNTTLEPQAVESRLPFVPYGGSKRDTLALESQRRALEACRKARDLYLDVFVHGRRNDDLYGLLLYGDSGRGKTRLACSLLCDLAFNGLHQIMFIEYTELFKRIRFSYRAKEQAYQNLFDQLTRAKVLVIDDFGTEVEGDLTWVLDNFGYLINERYSRNLPTIFTSNYWSSVSEEQKAPVESANPFEGSGHETSAALREEKKSQSSIDERRAMAWRVSARVRSRIREMCLEIKVEGFDYRNRIARNREILLERDRGKGK